MSADRHYFIVTAIYQVDGSLSVDDARAAFDSARKGNFPDTVTVMKDNVLHSLPIGLTFRLEQPSPISAEPYWVQINKEIKDG